MASEDYFEVEGVIKESLPGSRFLVELSDEGFEGHKINALVSGKMRMHYIKIVPGDKVKLEVPASEFGNESPIGRIIYRHR